MSIQSQAEFWLRNVCDVSEQSEAFIRRDVAENEELLDGLREYSIFLRKMYTNYSLFEVSKVERVMTKIGIWSDDLDNYHNMTNTGMCLLSLAKAGKLNKSGLEYNLHIDKALFKKYYKSSPTFSFEVIQQYGFYFHFFKNEKEVSSYSSCDAMELYNEDYSYIIYAIWYLSNHVLEKDNKDVVLPSTTAFLLADFDTLLLGSRTNKEIMYSLPQTVLNCVGDRRNLLTRLVSEFCGDSKLRIDLVINTYVFPNWIIKFKYKNKTIATFHVKADNLFVHLPLSYVVAKQVIDHKDEFSQGVRDNLNQFKCGGCGKCTNGSNMTEYKGYHLCSLNFSNFTTEDSRLIRMNLNTEEDLNSICWMIRAVLDDIGIC